VPTLFMPNPFHRDQHQRHNAQRLVDCGGARTVTDHIDESRNGAEAGVALASMLADFSARARMAEALQTLGPADGAAQITRLLTQFYQSNTNHGSLS